MTSKQLKRLNTNDQMRKRLAKFMAQQCFRNSELENLHAGTSPNSKSGDFSDVKVISPYGEIAWEKLSRLSDEEMKELMIDVVNRTYSFLTLLFSAQSNHLEAVLDGLEQIDIVSYWNDPEFVRL